MTKEKKNETVTLNMDANRFETGANTDAIEPRASCVFYATWHNAIERLPRKEQAKAYKMILDYSLNYIEPVDDRSQAYTIFMMAKPSIDKAETNYYNTIENGKKGGRPSTIDKEKVLELSRKGMKPAEIAKKLNYNRDSVKSVIYRNKGANANLNVNDNETVNDNVDDNKRELVSEASSETASPITEASPPTPPSPTELTWEEYTLLMDTWENSQGTGKSPTQIAKELNLNTKLCNQAITDYKNNHYKRKEKPKETKQFDVPLMNGGYLYSTEEELFNAATCNGTEFDINFDWLYSEYVSMGVERFFAKKMLERFKEKLDVIKSTTVLQRAANK